MQLSLDLVMVPLACAIRPESEQRVHTITMLINGRYMTDQVPLWVLRKGRSFVRGWMKAGVF